VLVDISIKMVANKNKLMHATFEHDAYRAPHKMPYLFDIVRLPDSHQHEIRTNHNKPIEIMDN